VIDAGTASPLSLLTLLASRAGGFPQMDAPLLPPSFSSVAPSPFFFGDNDAFCQILDAVAPLPSVPSFYRVGFFLLALLFFVVLFLF